jgi:hypothetical protein
MGGRGPAPKPAATRVRRNRTSGARTLETDATTSVPELPDRYDIRTRNWWEAVKTSPMADEYTGSDWQGLLAVAALLELWWFTADPRALAEWRVQCREYGLTPIARRSLAWEIRGAETGSAQPPKTRRSSASILSVLTEKPSA